MSADLYVSVGWAPGEMQRNIIQTMTLFLLQYKRSAIWGRKKKQSGEGKKNNKNQMKLLRVDTGSQSQVLTFFIIISALFPDRVEWLELGGI